MPDLTRLRGNTIMTAGPGGRKNPLFTKEERDQSRREAQLPDFLGTAKDRREVDKKLEEIRGMSKAEQRNRLKDLGITNPDEVLRFGARNVASIIHVAESVKEPNILEDFFSFVSSMLPEEKPPPPQPQMGGRRK